MTKRHLFALLLPTFVAAQGTPPRRAHHALVYDEANARVLLTGGSSPMSGGQCCGFFNDLWSFDGKAWTQLASSGMEMSGMRLAYDGKAKQILSFGGFSNDNRSLSDLRALQKERWVTLGQHPSIASTEGSFVYDAKHARFVAFGGSGGPGQRGRRRLRHPSTTCGSSMARRGRRSTSPAGLHRATARASRTIRAGDA